MFRRTLRGPTLIRFNNLSLMALSLVLGASLASGGFRTERAVAQGTSSSTPQEQKALLQALENAFTSIADQVEPAVVTIEARSTVRPAADEPRRGGGNDEDPQDGPFSLPDLFRRFNTPQPRGGGASTGSGFIVRRQGNVAYVLTNNHVIKDQDRFTITLFDKAKVDATLVGKDPKTDLAVLKITPDRPITDKEVAQLGDSDHVRVGQWAIAIGSPLKYDATLTVGVISAKGRDLSISPTSSYRDLIQTDAAINPGNSGGPLVNVDGQVVGINVAIASPGGLGNIGIGFAIPVNQAKRILDELITTGQVKRGYLGITCGVANRELPKELQDLYGVKSGALAETVYPNTPASKAGMKSEDVIVRFDGKPITSFTDLEDAVAATTPGRTVPVVVVRDKRELTLQITVALRPQEDALLGGPRDRTQPQQPQQPQEVQSSLGLTVRSSSEASTPGAEITAVAPGSAAEDAGLAPGDIITRVGNDVVRDLPTFRSASGKLKAGASVVLRVMSQSPNGRVTRIVLVRPQQ
jgi:serine protease Do